MTPDTSRRHVRAAHEVGRRITEPAGERPRSVLTRLADGAAAALADKTRAAGAAGIVRGFDRASRRGSDAPRQRLAARGVPVVDLTTASWQP